MKWHIARAVLAALPLPLAAGCADTLNARYTTPKMMDQGIIYILPGIQGVDYHYEDIRKGLQGSGIPCAIKIRPWGSQIPGIKLVINETDVGGNRAWAQTIAQEIQAYRQQYPGRPVHMIGQSGGCAICVFTAEALAKAGAPPLEELVLLDASLSADYDLRPALGECRKGIVNFYNLRDVAVLGAGTAIFGNLDGGHGDSAGQAGFTTDLARLYQVKVTAEMMCPGEGMHFADTCAAFAARYMAPWIIDQTWPAYVAGGR
jgi:pimeloyl-ACP methyl ester carboxylesterase